MGIDVSISMVDSNDLTRFVTLDSEKYGKNSNNLKASVKYILNRNK